MKRIFESPERQEGENFRVCVTSLGKPYDVAFTGFHRHPVAACNAAIEFRIRPPFWIACMIHEPFDRTNFQKEKVREAFESFTETLADTEVRRWLTLDRKKHVRKYHPSKMVGVAGPAEELYYLFIFLERDEVH